MVKRSAIQKKLNSLNGKFNLLGFRLPGAKFHIKALNRIFYDLGEDYGFYYDRYTGKWAFNGLSIGFQWDFNGHLRGVK